MMMIHRLITAQTVTGAMIGDGSSIVPALALRANQNQKLAGWLQTTTMPNLSEF
jgi:hypothetical protein